MMNDNIRNKFHHLENVLTTISKRKRLGNLSQREPDVTELSRYIRSRQGDLNNNLLTTEYVSKMLAFNSSRTTLGTEHAIHKKVRNTLSVLKALDSHLEMMSCQMSELENDFNYEKARLKIRAGEIEAAKHEWQKILKKSYSKNQFNRVLYECQQCKSDHHSLIDYFHEKYSFGYLGYISNNLNLKGVTEYTFGNEMVYFYNRGKCIRGEHYEGAIYCSKVKEPNIVRTVIEKIPLKLSVPCISFLPQEDLLLYVSSEPHLRLNGFNVKNRTHIVFSYPKHNESLNICDISFDSHTRQVYVLDAFKHVLVQYSLKGEYIREYSFPVSMQFPVSMCRFDKDKMLISFLQHLPLSNRSEYRKTYNPGNQYMVILDLSTGKSKYFQTESNTAVSKILGINEYFFFFCKNGQILKIDRDGKTVYAIPKRNIGASSMNETNCREDLLTKILKANNVIQYKDHKDQNSLHFLSV